MDGGGIFFIFVFFAIAAVFFRLAAGGFDKNRVRRYIEEQGGELLDTQWNPFGRGWYGEKDSRIYRVQFRDRYGNIREATVKTSLYSGVYFTDDIIVVPAQAQSAPENRLTGPPPSDEPASDLQSELEHLRAENARLQQELARARQEPRPLFNSETGHGNP